MTEKLDKLAAKEAKLKAKVRAINGTIEEQLGLIKEQKIFKKYQKIHLKYFKIAQKSKDGEERTEALKRGIFLNWLPFVEPDFLTGVGEPQEGTAIALYALLEEDIAAQKIDNELMWMLFYYATFEGVIQFHVDRRFPQLTTFVLKSDPLLVPVLLEKLSGESFENRGQMGMYWEELL